MTTREFKLYPTPENCQHDGVDALPWERAKSYFESIVRRLPEQERASVVLRGMSGLSLYGARRVSPDEIVRERMLLLLSALEQAQQGGNGMDKDQVSAVLEQFRALAS